MKTVIIAEGGVNHNGSIEIAEKLIIAAAQSGADYIKFQTFVTDNLVSKKAKQADYQIINLKKETNQYRMLKKLELSSDDHYKLLECCRKQNIAFFSTAFDLESIDLLVKLHPSIWKIPSGEITNLPYLRKIGLFGKPVILSTGMATLGEIETAIEILEKSGLNRNEISVLHCTTEYPAPLSEVNLRAMVTIGDAFKVKYGYSDHTEGIEISLAAVAMGATIIEKHFTLDRSMEGPDHKASLEPHELKNLISGIRKIEMAFGNGIKAPTLSEIPNINAARKSIVANRMIKTGEIFSLDNLTVKRPGNGLSPMLWDRVLGLTSKKDFYPDEQIEL